LTALVTTEAFATSQRSGAATGPRVQSRLLAATAGAARDLTFEVRERMNAAGEVLVGLDAAPSGARAPARRWA
jgi:hypothetical protein